MTRVTEIDSAAADAWLGDDLVTWSQSIRNGYIRSFIIFALHETGVFERMREAGPQTSRELAEACGVNAWILDGILNFLTHADVVVAKKDDRFQLTDRGREWLFSDMVLAMSFGAVGGYACILYELVPSLRDQKRYGEDFVRPGDLIAKGSYYTGRQNYPWVVEQLRKLGASEVADLGCGSADVLIGFAKLDGDLRGVGIDISPAAIEEAGRRVRNAGLDDRIRLEVGDITDPASYAGRTANVDAFNAIMVLHEFLRDGEEAVVDIFRGMKEAFPGRYLLIGEFDRISDEEYGAMPYPARIHALFYQHVIHPLTWQGLPIAKEEWLKLFDRAGLELVAMNDTFPFRLVEFVLRF